MELCFGYSVYSPSYSQFKKWFRLKINEITPKNVNNSVNNVNNLQVVMVYIMNFFVVKIKIL